MTTLPILDSDALCPACGYNLRGLKIAGTCPECAVPIRHGLPPPISPANQRAWLSRLLFGILLSVVGLVLVSALLGSYALAQFGRWNGWPQRVEPAIHVLAAGLLLAGGWLSTSGPRGLRPVDDPFIGMRLFVRVGLLACLLSLLAAYTTSPADRSFRGLCFLVSCLHFGIIAEAVRLAYVSAVLRRLGHSGIAASLWGLAWAYPAALVAVLWAPFFLAFDVPTAGSRWWLAVPDLFWVVATVLALSANVYAIRKLWLTRQSSTQVDITFTRAPAATMDNPGEQPQLAPSGPPGDNNVLRLADASWLRVLANGLTITMWAIIGAVMASLLPYPLSVMAKFVCAAFAAYGFWRFTEAYPIARPAGGDGLRIAVRVLAVASFGLLCLERFLYIADTELRFIIPFLSDFLVVVPPVMILAAETLRLRYLLRLLTQTAEERTGSDVRWLSWTLAPVAGVAYIAPIASYWWSRATLNSSYFVAVPAYATVAYCCIVLALIALFLLWIRAHARAASRLRRLAAGAEQWRGAARA